MSECRSAAVRVSSLGVEEHDVGVVVRLEPALARQPEDLGGPGAAGIDPALEREAAGADAGGVHERQPHLEPARPGRDHALAVLAKDAAARAVVGRDDVDRTAPEGLPEGIAVPGLAQRRAERQRRARERLVVGRLVEQQIGQAGLAVGLLPAGPRGLQLADGVGRAEVVDQ